MTLKEKRCGDSGSLLSAGAHTGYSRLHRRLLAMAQYAATLKDVNIIVVCGVHFMGETAKLLCPDKKVLIPDLEAAARWPTAALLPNMKIHQGASRHTVVSYVNTSVGVKALTDILVTSGNAHKIINSLPQDEKIIFGPDRNLGNYINSVTDATCCCGTVPAMCTRNSRLRK